MKRIPLRNRKGEIIEYALVDDEDFEILSKRKWSKNPKGYAIGFIYSKGKTKMQRLHRFLMGEPKGQLIDHRNNNKLDNRKSNLRICNNSQNLCNRGKNKNNKSGFKGVSWSKKNSKWQAQIMIKGKHIRGFYFDTPKEAAEKYSELSKKYHGEFGRIE